MVTIEAFKKIKPMMATSSEPFDSDNHIFEVKWDGFRCLSYLDEATFLQSRNLLDFSLKFPELAGIHNLMKQKPVVIDGEIIIMDKGLPSFYELQKRGWTHGESNIARAALNKPATYIVFDILYVGKEKLISRPLMERKDILSQVIEINERMFVSEGILGQGIEFYKACITRNVEGVIAKKIDSVYVPGKRSLHWKKFKKIFEGDFVICGYKQTHRDTDRVDALLLGRILKDGPVFQGTVGVGLGGITGRRMYEILSPLRIENTTLKVPKNISQGFIWVRPRICCSVEFLEPARDGGLRHPVFRGVREDMAPEDCAGIEGATAGRN